MANRWASGDGSVILSGLNIDTITNVSPFVMRLAFSGSPTLTSIVKGFQLTISGCTNSIHDGTFEIAQNPNNTAKTIDIYNFLIEDSSQDETSSPGTAIAKQNAALNQEPSAAAYLAGFLNGQRPPAGWLNRLFSRMGLLGGFFTLSNWGDEVRSGEELSLIKNQGIYRFDPDATDEPGEGFQPLDVGSGLGIIEAPSADAISAMLSAFIPEILPPVTASLDFGSTAQSAISTATVTVPGAQVGDTVSLGAPSTIEAGFLWSGFVSATDTVTIRLAKITTGTVDPAVGTWAVTVTRPNSMPVITTRGLKIFVNLMAGIYTSGTLETDLGIADNEAAFNLLVNSKQHRAAILDGGTIEAIIAGSAIADAIILATGGY